MTWIADFVDPAELKQSGATANQPLVWNGTRWAPGPIARTSVVGSVASAGAITSGTGFTVNKTGTGVYAVSFSPALASIPAVFYAPVGTGAVFLSVLPSAAGFTVTTATDATFTTPADKAWVFQAIIP